MEKQMSDGGICRRLPEALGVVGGDIEIDQVGLEAASFDSAVGDADDHPDRAQAEGGATEMAPDEGANQETEERRDQVENIFLFGAEIVTDQSGYVDAHEREEGAEVQEVRALVVSDDKGTYQRDYADKDDIVARDVAFGVHSTKKLFGNTVAATHAIEQARCSELRAHPRADVGDQNREIDELEQKVAAGGLRDERKSGGDFISRERLIAPDELRGVDLE